MIDENSSELEYSQDYVKEVQDWAYSARWKHLPVEVNEALIRGSHWGYQYARRKIFTSPLAASADIPHSKSEMKRKNVLAGRPIDHGMSPTDQSHFDYAERLTISELYKSNVQLKAERDAYKDALLIIRQIVKTMRKDDDDQVGDIADQVLNQYEVARDKSPKKDTKGET
jgi:hypothetical protein